MNHQLPRLLILGRPNVGKSTLFNRLLRKKHAITSPVPGVTRDIIEAIWHLPSGRSCLVSDSAGCRPDTQDFLEQMAREKSLQQIREAAIVLLVVEGASLVSEDYILIDDLRKTGKKILLVANKCDSPEKDNVLGELWSLGFGEPICISAEHNRNISQLESLIDQHLPAIEEEKSAQPDIKITILGRPNAGKSSMANCLCGEDRSLVSEVSGTTRDVVSSFFTHNDKLFQILDTAGLRRASKINESLEFYASKRTEAALEDCDVALLLIDIKEGLTDQDKKITDKIILSKKPFLFVLTKSDLEQNSPKRVKGMALTNDILKREVEKLRFQFPMVGYVPIVAVSAKYPDTMSELLKAVMSLHQEAGRQADEHELVEALHEWCEDQPPPRRGRKRPPLLKSLKQVGQYPPRFALKVYGEVEEGYVRYIIKNLRKEFKFPHVPLLIEVVHRT